MHSILSWSIFVGIILVLIVMDLVLFHRSTQRNNHLRKNMLISIFYFSVAILFGLWIGHSLGVQRMTEYYTGYLVEQSLSLDNLFIIALIFSYFNVPRNHQDRLLFWGILGVIVLRGIMIGLGSILIVTFSWMIDVFGGILMIMGCKMLLHINNAKKSVTDNKLINFISHTFKFNNFIMALVCIEIADVIFALDSIPAIFVITTDPYIVYTSNIFAVMGLRSLFFALRGLLSKFIYLQYSLGLILLFIGSKIFIAHGFGWEQFPPLISLGITVILLLGGIFFSLWKNAYGHKKTY